MAYTTIDDPSEYFQTLLYTGNATDDRNLTNSANAGDFKPDWLWLHVFRCHRNISVLEK